MSKRVLTRLSILSCLLIKRLPKGRGGGEGEGAVATPESSYAFG